MNLVVEMDTWNITQWYAIFFFFLSVKLGENATTIHGKLHQAFGGDAMSRTQERTLLMTQNVL